MTDAGKGVTVASINEIAGVVPNVLIQELLRSCQPAKEGLYSRVGPVVEEIVAEGWSAGGIIVQVFFPITIAKRSYTI
jgi:replication factor C subunit 2/4